MKNSVIVLVALGLNGALAANVLADDFSNCACVSTPANSSASIGKIVGSNGDVLYTGTSGYLQAKTGARLVAGSQVSVGDNADARISVGSSCNLSISANSIASVLQPKGTGGKICVRVSSLLDPTTNLVQEGSSTQQGGGSTGFQIGSALFVTGAAGASLISGGGDNPASE